jgi:hypothetical protein
MTRSLQTPVFKRVAHFLPLLAILAGLELAPVACGTSTTTVPDSGPADSGPVDAGPFSACGYMGDVGVNDAGIGQFCLQISDCPLSAPICSSINNNPASPQLDTYFCVLPCDECDAPNFCGANATCVCQSPHNCGCTPNKCSNIFPDSGLPPYTGYPSCTTPDGGDGG